MEARELMKENEVLDKEGLHHMEAKVGRTEDVSPYRGGGKERISTSHFLRYLLSY